MPLAITITGQKRAWFLYFQDRTERQNTSAAMRVECCGPLLKGVMQSMSFRELVRFIKSMKNGGMGLREQLDKEKKPYIFVGMVCVREAYQGQGYMRKVMDMAFAEGNRLQVPVILDTDAKSKCDKYMHLGMELAGTRDWLGDHGNRYFAVLGRRASCHRGRDKKSLQLLAIFCEICDIAVWYGDL